MSSPTILVGDARYEFDVLSAYSDLVTQYSQQLISFPRLQEFRKCKFAELKAGLAKLENQHGAVRLGERPKPERRVYWALGKQPLNRSNLPKVTWLEASSGSPPTYPLVLDLLEAACRNSNNPILGTLCSAIAPTWEELISLGIVCEGASRPRWDDIHGGHGDDVYERYLLGAAALVLSSLGEDFGIYLTGLSLADHTSIEFTARLLRETRFTGMVVAIHSEQDLTQDSKLARVLDVADCSCPPTSSDNDPGGNASLLTAFCPEGVPNEVALRLEVPCEGRFPHSYIADAQRQQVLANLDAGERRRLHERIGDAWDPRGWGYLRRARHVIETGSPDGIVAHHSALVYGLRAIGRDYLLEQYRALCTDRVLNTLTTDDRTNALIGAGRLVSIARKAGGPDAAIPLFERALNISRQPLTAYITYSIANTYASKRDPDSLAVAEAVYDRALAELADISAADDRVYSEIRYRNGLALVRYLQERNEEALQLEEECLDLARQAAEQFPRILDWAFDVLTANTAKLLERRFSDLGGTVKLLREMLAYCGPGVREHARIELSRIMFDTQDYEAAVDLLHPAYGDTDQHLFDEPRELLARMMLSFSRIATGRIAEGQHQRSRIAYLCHSIGTASALKFLETLRQEVQSTSAD